MHSARTRFIIGHWCRAARAHAILAGCDAHVAAEQQRERWRALESKIIADLRDGVLRADQHSPGCLEAQLREVLMRSATECLFEQTKEVMLCHGGVRGHLRQTDGPRVAGLHEVARACKPAIQL